MKVWIPLGIFFFLAAAFSGVWLMNVRYDERILETQCRVIASQSAARLEEGVRIRLALVRQLRSEWLLKPYTDEETFRHRVQPILEQFPGFLAINWIDPKGIIRWVVPPGPNAAAVGQDLHFHPTARTTFVRAEGSGKDEMTPPINLYQGGLGVAAYFPIRDGTKDYGYLNAVFRIRPMVRQILGPSLLENYAIRITADGRTLFSNGKKPVPGWKDRIPPATIAVGSARRSLYVDPIETSIPLKQRMEGIALFLAGILFAGAIAVLTRQALSAHERLRRSEKRYRDIFESSMDPIYVSTPEGRLLDFNEATMRTFKAESRSQLMEVDLSRDIYQDPEERRQLMEALTKYGAVRQYPLRLKALDDSPLFVRVSARVARDSQGRITAFHGVIHDETETRKMREEMVRIQRLESMSDLAGGIAHDFNNILAAIMANASMLELGLEDPEKRVYTERIQASVESASRLTGQLLQFARGSLQKTELVDLNALVDDTLLILERSIDPNITIRRELDPQLPPVEGDPGRLQQILLNLLVNARDALPDGGVITIRTARSGPPADHTDPAIMPGELSSDPWICLSVSDTGHGMTEATKKRIFEPFFTTKGRTKGTGLGLAVAYGVVRDHGGAIQVESAPGRGATFHVFLPTAPGSAPAREESPADPVPEAMATILVVDDDEAVRHGLTSMLESAGYRVIQAADGIEAMAVFRKDHATIDAVILDMTMPGPSGIEIMDDLRKVNADIPVVLSTGYIEGGWDLGSRPPDAFLHKPYGRVLLLKTLTEVLERNRPEG